MLNAQLAGIRIHIHFSLFFLLIAMFYLGNGKLVILTMMFSLFHEYAHAFAAVKLGYSPVAITAGLFGGVLHLKERHIEPEAELLIYIAGPFFNLALAMLGYYIMLIFECDWVYYAVAANLVLALFNLLPLYPLDGGKILNAYLSKFIKNDTRYRVSGIISTIFSILLFLFGLYLIQYNMANLIICALAINLYNAGKDDQRYSYARVKKIYADLEEEKHK